jgi:hypothetical protein
MSEGKSPEQGHHHHVINAAERFLGRNKDNAEQTPWSGMGLEVPRLLASEFAERMNSLGKRAAILARQSTEVEVPGTSLEIGYGTPALVSVTIDQERLGGLGEGKIELIHDESGGPSNQGAREVQQFLGVNTPNLLRIYLHMDDATVEQTRAHLEKTGEDRTLLRTDYYFDAGGRYAKFTTAPNTKIPNKLLLHQFANPDQRFPMMPADFTLATFALLVLDKRLHELEQVRQVRTKQ